MMDVSIIDIEATPEKLDQEDLIRDLWRDRYRDPDHVKAYQADVARRLFDGIFEGEE